MKIKNTIPASLRSICIVFIAMFFVASCFSSPQDTEPVHGKIRKPPENLESVTVTRIVDGDTIVVTYRGDKESIRLIGIDTPESRNNKKTRRDAERTGQDIKTIIATGKEAANFTRSLVHPGDTGTIEFDVQKRDKYGRLLCYFYLSDGRMLNEEIVKAGYANVMTIPPNVKYQDLFIAAYRSARENSRGLWK
ncbi:MAG: thermonuclease family protein [Proteobacteria bacterium]|nr:thermonuclease family protein [Pseudomonadota bacterium]